jgi:hypothetical protein
LIGKVSMVLPDSHRAGDIRSFDLAPAVRIDATASARRSLLSVAAKSR